MTNDEIFWGDIREIQLDLLTDNFFFTSTVKGFSSVHVCSLITQVQGLSCHERQLHL